VTGSVVIAVCEMGVTESETNTTSSIYTSNNNDSDRVSGFSCYVSMC